MSTNVAQAREALGVHLRQLRRDASLTGRQLVAGCGWLPSKVSKIEKGKQTPSPADINAWTIATGQPHAAAALRAELAALESFYRDWRRQLRAGMRFRQAEALNLEAAVRHLRVFESSYVPGLLQTAEYAALRLAQGARLHRASIDIDAAVAVRMRRQAVLQLPTKHFDFVIAEAALSAGNAASGEIMVAQIDHLRAATLHPSVRIGINPAGTIWPIHIDHGFWLYDDAFVLVETAVAELRLAHTDEVRTYRRIHGELSSAAVYGEAARTVMISVKGRL